MKYKLTSGGKTYHVELDHKPTPEEANQIIRDQILKEADKVGQKAVQDFTKEVLNPEIDSFVVPFEEGKIFQRQRPDEEIPDVFDAVSNLVKATPKPIKDAARYAFSPPRVLEELKEEDKRSLSLHLKFFRLFFFFF